MDLYAAVMGASVVTAGLIGKIATRHELAAASKGSLAPPRLVLGCAALALASASLSSSYVNTKCLTRAA